MRGSKARPRVSGKCGAAALVLATLAAWGGTARAGVGLDPFRAGGARSVDLNPFRVADTDPVPSLPPTAPAASGSPAPSATAPPAPPSDPAPVATPARASMPVVSCHRDEDCTGESICQSGTCQAIQIRTNILYLYYREGSFREALLLYWSRKGPSGYTVVAPIYWHYWSPTSEARVVAPFYWHFEDRLKQSALTVIVPGLPVAWGHEPGASSFAIWPLFYASSKYGWAVPLAGTFKLTDPDSRRSLGAVGYLYWWWRTPERATDLGVPLFFSRRSPSHAFTYAVPLTFYWRNADDASTLALPLFYANTHQTGSWLLTWLGYAHREGTEYGRSLAWLYWWGGDERTRSTYHVFFPLVWDFEHKTGGDTVVFPLLWSFRGPDTNTTVAFPGLPLIHVRDGSGWFNTLFPLYWSFGDDKTGSAHRLLLPLFYWARGEHDQSKTLVTPLGGYTRDDRDGTRSWAFLPLLSFAHRDPGGERKMLTPLYLSREDRTGDAMTRLVGLLFYRRTDPAGSSTALFPIFWRFWDAATGATATALLPLFAHREGPRDTTTLVGPLYWRSFTNGGWGAGLLPIAYFGQNAGRTHAVVFPLFWHFGGERSSTTVAFPIFYWHRDAHGYDSAFPPLLFIGNHDGESYAIQFPLLFHLASARDGSSTTITPLGYLHHDTDGTSLAVGPILPLFYARFGHDRSHLALFPVFWHFEDRVADKSTTVVGPFWHRRWGEERTDALFPLFHWRRGARPGGADETSFTIFPLVHYRRDADTRVLVTPLGASARGPDRQAGFVGPYLWYEDRELAVRTVPLLFTDLTQKVDGQRLRQWGPWFRIDGPGFTSEGLFPLFGRYADGAESDTWVFPTFFHQRRQNGDAVDAFLPLFWHSKLAGRTTTVVGPYFDRRTPDRHTYGLVPLFVRTENAARTMTFVPPLLLFQRRDADGQSSLLSCLLYFHSRSPQGTTTVLFPLFWSSSTADRRRDILFPVFWHFADTSANTSWTLAGPVFWSTAGRRSTVGLLPIAWHTRDAGNGDRVTALMPLFYQASGADTSSFYTLLAGYHRRGPDHFWYAGPIVHTDSVGSRFSAVIPLWFSHTDKATETTTTVIPPLLRVSRQNPESGFSTTLGLFWNSHDIASSTTLGLPLFFDSHDYHLSRVTVFLPFVFRYARETDGNTYWVVPPFFYRHSSPTDVSMVGFPLVWDFKRDNWRTTVVFPFFARWRRPDYVGTYVFPTYYYRQGLRADGAPDGTYRRFVLPFYDSGVKRPGDFMWEVLGGLFGHERIGPHNYLRLFYMTFEASPTTPAQTAWYGQRPSPPRKAPSRGLSLAGW